MAHNSSLKICGHLSHQRHLCAIKNERPFLRKVKAIHFFTLNFYRLNKAIANSQKPKSKNVHCPLSIVRCQGEASLNSKQEQLHANVAQLQKVAEKPEKKRQLRVTSYASVYPELIEGLPTPEQ